jgi:hypothetical protein
MSKFKVGDRVRAYGSSVIQSHTSDDGPIKGVVNSILGESVEVATDCGGFYTFHTKQLRRLKPKSKLREYWLGVYSDGSGYVYNTEEEARNWSYLNEVVRVREVCSKKVR